MMCLQSKCVSEKIELKGYDKVDNCVNCLIQCVSAFEAHKNQAFRDLLVTKSDIERPNFLEDPANNLPPARGLFFWRATFHLLP